MDRIDEIKKDNAKKIIAYNNVIKGNVVCLMIIVIINFLVLTKSELLTSLIWIFLVPVMFIIIFVICIVILYFRLRVKKLEKINRQLYK